jgi:glycine oxidase
MKSQRILLVGQGLAGTILAARLLEAGHEVVIIDENPPLSSSKVAAGLVNPIAGKRLARSWRVDELLPAAKEFYRSQEAQFGRQFFHEVPIVKLFSAIEEQNSWLARSADPAYAPYLQLHSADLPPAVAQQFGSITITGGGWLDLPLFLSSARKQFGASGILRTETFDITALDLTSGHPVYRLEAFEKVIFCEGHRITQNPFFNWLPVAPTKGEILDVTVPDLALNQVLTRGAYLVPIGEELFRVGATYNWREPNENPTEAGKAELMEKLESMLNLPVSVTDHKAGIRPAVRDRRPLIGWHPEHSQLGLFNGMGSKGVLLAPFFAQQLVNSISGNKTLDAEVDLIRYHSLKPHTLSVA